MKLKLLFLTIYLITITYGADDACVGKPNSQCTSANGCTWTKTADANCANQCSTLEQGQCATPCSWSSAACTKKTFTCTELTNAQCTDTTTHANELCTWTGEQDTGSCGDANIDCESKNEGDCTTAANTCIWTPATCSLSGTDTCIGSTENACTGSCVWTPEAGTCATTGGDSGSGTASGTDEGSESDSSGFLNLSVFICVLFILFL